MNLLRSIQMSENDINELKRRAEDGELTMDIVNDTIEAVEGEIGIKCDAIAEIINSNDSDILALENEVKRLSIMIDNLKLSNQCLKSGLLDYLKRQDTQKVKTQFHNFSICKNGGKLPVQITDEVPEEFLRYEPCTDMDKIRKVLENGQELEFAHLKERGEHLRIK